MCFGRTSEQLVFTTRWNEEPRVDDFSRCEPYYRRENEAADSGRSEYGYPEKQYAEERSELECLVHINPRAE